MRLLVGIKKGESARYLSHLDMQRAMQRWIKRAGIPALYSSGFNPHPLISFASALPVGMTGDCEAVELQTEALDLELTIRKLCETAAPGIEAVRLRVVDSAFPSLTPLTQAARLELIFKLDGEEDAAAAAERMLERARLPLFVEKRGKAGIKSVDASQYIIEMSCEPRTAENAVSLAMTAAHSPAGSLPVALFAAALIKELGLNADITMHRNALLTEDKRGKFINILDYDKGL